jgi:hypothetical protein
MHGTCIKIIAEGVFLSRKAVIDTYKLTAAFTLFSHNFLKWESLCFCHLICNAGMNMCKPWNQGVEMVDIMWIMIY